MGITRVDICCCDLCGHECSASDGQIDITVRPGDGRDAGPSSIVGRLRYDQPYAAKHDIVCNACKFEWLKIYLDRNRPNWSATNKQQ